MPAWSVPPGDQVPLRLIRPWAVPPGDQVPLPLGPDDDPEPPPPEPVRFTVKAAGLPLSLIHI